MSGEGKWQTVGKKDHHQRRSVKGKEERAPSGGGIVGLRESSTAFSRFSEQQERGKEAAQVEPRPTEPHRRPSRRSKPATEKQHRQSFDDCVKELDNETLLSVVQEAQSKYFDSPQNYLKEVLGFLQLQFADVEAEKDFVFSNRRPGYPLSALDSTVQDTLLSAVAACPSLAQEGMFRHSVDCLLGEVRAELPTYGTRVMLQALAECNPTVCSEATERVWLLLQSCLNKVPEALSLLWAGLPHPLSHPSIALGAWHRLCLPLLHSVPNVPRQVLAFTVEYSTSVLAHVSHEECERLREMIPPAVLCSLLTSPSLVSRRKQSNTLELAKLLEDHILTECPQDVCVRYFTAALQSLAGTEHTQLLVSFAAKNLLQSPDCLQAWEKRFSSHLDPSSLLLHHLHSLSSLPSTVPPHKLAYTLQVVSRKAAPEQQALCKALVERLEMEESEGDNARNQGNGCAVKVMVILAAMVYLTVLVWFLLSVAKEGPNKHLAAVESLIAQFPEVLGRLWQVLDAVCGLFLNLL